MPELSNRLNEVTNKVGKLNEQLELAQVSNLAEQDRALEDLREKFDLELNSLAAVVNNHRDAFNHDLAVLESRIDKVQKVVQDLDESLSAVRTKQASHSHDGVNKIPELDNKLKDLGTNMVELAAQDIAGRRHSEDRRVDKGSGE